MIRQIKKQDQDKMKKIIEDGLFEPVSQRKKKIQKRQRIHIIKQRKDDLSNLYSEYTPTLKDKKSRAFFIYESLRDSNKKINGKSIILGGVGFQPMVYKERFYLSEMTPSEIFKMNDVAEIRRLSVRKSHRGKGIATKLLKHTIKYISENTDYNKIHLTTTSDRPNAHKLFEKVGFKKTKTEKGGYIIHYEMGLKR